MLDSLTSLVTYSLNSGKNEASLNIKGNKVEMQTEEVDYLIKQLGHLRSKMQPEKIDIASELDEDTYRPSALVREVHHRIKNNLQGVTGILRNFLIFHPELNDPITNVISQVNSIAVIHGLQGRANLTRVRLCELIAAIAVNIESLWQVNVIVDQSEDWAPCRIAEQEAVPLALVMNELISNAVKHGDKAQGINIKLSRKSPDIVNVIVLNFGQLLDGFNCQNKPENGTGLQLIESLLPKKGIHASWENIGEQVSVELDISTPVIKDEEDRETIYNG
jgi:two-component sensor histidine kinase